ncbi:hypothetical protein AB0L65_34285 [Nonomuraea sp. NPDC052116]|uniref:hypothetical protein n=1 Tax=Nonomuraea sp. NPDC052116 TaxID=3155665 RepID=UPI00341F7970
MRRQSARWAAVVVALGVAASGCGTRPADTGVRIAASETPSPEVSESASLLVKVFEEGQQDDVPNPGSGAGDPRLAAALLPGFRDVRQRSYQPGAVVALPVADLRSTFIPERQISSPLEGPEECTKWTAGMWLEVLSRYNAPGAQLAVAMMEPATPVGSRRPMGAVFSEAIITGPAAMLDRLGDPELPARCGRLPVAGDGFGEIQPLTVPHLGERSWAYRITGTGKVPVWHWVEVVQTSHYVLEIRIPNQDPRPRTDPAELLPLIAQEAYAKAARLF